MPDSVIRLIFFLTALFLFAGLEFLASFRSRQLSRKSRWPANFGLIIIANLLIRVLVPSGLAFYADVITERSFGILNLFNFSLILKVIIALLALDFLIYFQHILFHKVQWLWRVHRVHHTDIDLDVTSSLRFHPIEILVSIFYKLVCFFILGVPAEAVVIFEVTLSLMAMFNHSNLHIPARIERLLRWVLVTPQMHIIHHSVKQEESDKNFGFNLSLWDRLFSTYLSQFSKPQSLIGQVYYRDKNQQKLWSLLSLPFKSSQALEANFTNIANNSKAP